MQYFCAFCLVCISFFAKVIGCIVRLRLRNVPSQILIFDLWIAMTSWILHHNAWRTCFRLLVFVRLSWHSWQIFQKSSYINVERCIQFFLAIYYFFVFWCNTVCFLGLLVWVFPLIWFLFALLLGIKVFSISGLFWNWLLGFSSFQVFFQLSRLLAPWVWGKMTFYAFRVFF